VQVACVRAQLSPAGGRARDVRWMESTCERARVCVCVVVVAAAAAAVVVVVVVVVVVAAVVVAVVAAAVVAVVVVVVRLPQKV
jgi:hypothetical protein